jgi:hypothetical protein
MTPVHLQVREYGLRIVGRKDIDRAAESVEP